jgi:hypothetical protein
VQCLTISALKNGLESLKAHLGSVAEELKMPPESVWKQEVERPDKHREEHEFAKRTGRRLQEMICEFDSKIRFCDGLLESMTLATQMVRIPLELQLFESPVTYLKP